MDELLAGLQVMNSGVVGYKSTRGRKLQFSDRQLRISDRGDYGCSKSQNFNFVPKFSQNERFCVFGRKFSDKKKIFCPVIATLSQTALIVVFRFVSSLFQFCRACRHRRIMRPSYWPHYGRPSVCPCAPYLLLTRKQKAYRKKTSVNVFRSGSSRRGSFSSDRKVKG